MEKEILNRMLSDKVAELTSGDESLKAKIDDILLLQKQIDVEPVELEVDVKDVVARYRIGGYAEVVKCKTAIFYHAAGLWVVSKPTFANNGKGGALFEMLTWMCDWQDSREECSDEDEKEMNDTLCLMIMHLLSIPSDVFTDMDFMVDVADYVIKRRAEYYQKYAEQASKSDEETLEDAMANAEFEAVSKMEEEIASELEKMDERKSRKAKGNEGQ